MRGRPAPSVRVHVASIDTRAATELCVRSARAHTRLPFELVVGDGGSTDGSVEVLRDLERRGWLRLEVEPEGRSHAEWLDGWLQACEARYAVFLDSDVELRRRGWLEQLLEVAETAGAALVCGELLPGDPHYVHPLTGDEARLAERPSPWLLLVDCEQVRPLGAGFAFVWEEDPTAPGGGVSYDVGADLLRRIARAGLPWREMPRSYRRAYRHYGGLSWKPRGGLRGLRGLRRRLTDAQISWRLLRLRLRQRLPPRR